MLSMILVAVSAILSLLVILIQRRIIRSYEKALDMKIRMVARRFLSSEPLCWKSWDPPNIRFERARPDEYAVPWDGE